MATHKLLKATQRKPKWYARQKAAALAQLANTYGPFNVQSTYTVDGDERIVEGFNCFDERELAYHLVEAHMTRTAFSIYKLSPVQVPKSVAQIHRDFQQPENL